MSIAHTLYIRVFVIDLLAINFKHTNENTVVSKNTDLILFDFTRRVPLFRGV